MPSQPPDKYERQFDFTDFSQTQPTRQQPGDQIDIELNEVRQSVNQTIDRLGLIQRDDGALRDDVFDYTPLNNAVIEAQSARDDAVAAKVEADAARDQSVDIADALVVSVESDRVAADAAASAAAASASSALGYKNQAEASASEASSFKDVALGAAADADLAKAGAETAQTAAETAQGLAETAASAASASAVAAAGSASDASVSAASALAVLNNATTGLPSKLANVINWVGVYDNGTTYNAGDGVRFGNDWYVLKEFIGAAGYDPVSYPNSWTWLIPDGVGGNPFDQSLNTTDTVNFASVISDAGAIKNLYTGDIAGGDYAEFKNNGDIELFGAAVIVGYATQSYVTSQGYITSAALAPYVLASSLGTAAYQNVSYFVRSPSVAGTDGQVLSWNAGTSLPVWIDNATGTVFTTGTNKTGSTLTKGTVVYINGAQGSKFTLAKAQASGDPTSAQTLGVVQSDIANNASGNVITFGEISGINTSAYADGTQLYLSPTTAGAFTSTKPSAPDHLVYVAIVSYSHAVNGKVLVKVQNGYELEELHDVAIASVADKNLLAYESSTGLWKNKSFATLDLLTATTAASTYFTIPTGTTAQYIRGNGTLSTFSTDVIAAVPSASTSTAGKVQLATVAEAVAGTDASKAVTAAGVAQEISRRLARRFFQTNQAVLTTQTSGTGAGYVQLQQYTNISGGNAGVAGFARGYVLLTAPYGVGIDYAKPIGFGVWTRAFNSAAYSGTEWRCGIGYTSSPTAGVAVGDLTVRGFGFKWAQGGNVFLQVHDGTTLRNIDTGYTPATTGALPQIYLEAFSDGAGNVTALVRVYPATSGAASTDYTATSANGPTGALAVSPNNGFMYQLQTSTTHTQVLNGGGLHPTFFYD